MAGHRARDKQLSISIDSRHHAQEDIVSKEILSLSNEFSSGIQWNSSSRNSAHQVTQLKAEFEPIF
jgi:hypothetical protein